MAGPDHAQPGDPQRADQANDAAAQAQAQRDHEQMVNDSLLYPSVGRVNALAMTHRDPPIAELTQILQQHPEAYDAVMRAIHRNWGNMAAARCAVLVPHFSAGAPGARVPLVPGGGETPAAGGDAGQADVDVDPISGEHDISASAGPVTGHVTAQPPNRLTGQGGQVTGGSVEVRGDAGANTNVGGSVGHTTDGTTTASVDATHRVSPNVAVGADAQVSADNHGTVTGQGGATIRLHVNDVTQLRIHGAVDTQGQLNQEVALEILKDPTPRVPISDDGARRLRFFLRATEPTRTGGQADAAGGGASVQVGIGGSF